VRCSASGEGPKGPERGVRRGPAGPPGAPSSGPAAPPPADLDAARVLDEAAQVAADGLA
jgi:hypothetical protein